MAKVIKRRGSVVHRAQDFSSADPAQAKNNVYVPPLTISRKEFIVGGSDESFRNIIYQMVMGMQRLSSCREIFGRHLGLTGSQFAVLMGVAFRQKVHGVSVSDLATHVRLAQPHVTTEVGRLLNKGLLKKEINLRDQRSVLVSLSPGGKKAIDDVAPLVRKVNDCLFAGIKKGEMETVARAMRRLTLNADSAVAQIRRENPKRTAGANAGQRRPHAVA